MPNVSPKYKIRQLIEITGASEFLIRIWELRYKALCPMRTSSGRRLYTENDLLKVRALLTLTAQGHRVGKIARKTLPELEHLLNEKSPSPAKDTTSLNLGKILAAAKNLCWDEVQALISNSAKVSSPLKWTHNLILPLLAEMGQQVEKGQLSISQEHILSAIIKDSFANVFRAKSKKKISIRIVFAAPEGDFHDMGIMLASRVANYHGATTLYLGAHMPKNELVAVCVRYKATHLLLSSTTDTLSGAKEDYFGYVNFLDRNLAPNIALWLAGPLATRYNLSLKRPFRILESFQRFEAEIKNVSVRFSKATRAKQGVPTVGD